jgi:tetratricopeptide (TPR) repeat protein
LVREEWHVDNLTSILRMDNLVVFLGAGAVCDSGLPVGNAPSKAIVRSLFETTELKDLRPQVEWPRLEAVMTRLDETLPNAAIQIAGTFAKIGLGTVPQILASISQPSWVWLTTNFDDQIERALELHSRQHQVLVRREEISVDLSTVWNRQLVIKLHGDGSLGADTQNLGATLPQIFRAYPKPAEEAVNRLAESRPILIVGYAAKDPDLTGLVANLCAKAIKVAWLNLAEEQPTRITLLLNGREDAIYLPGDAGSVLARELAEKKPDAIETHEWPNRVEAWCRCQVGYSLALALAAICLDQGEEVCQELVPRILAKVPEEDRLLPKKALLQLEHLRRFGNPVGELAERARELQRKAAERSIDIETRLRCLYVAGRAFHWAGQYSDEEKALARAVELLVSARSTDNALKVSILIQLGIAQSYRGKPPEVCSRTLEDAVSAAEVAYNPILLAQAKRQLAVHLKRVTGDQDRAWRILCEIEPMVREIGFPNEIMKVELNKAEVLREKGEMDQALEINERVANEARLRGDHEIRLYAVSNGALCRVHRGEVDAADRAFKSVADDPQCVRLGEILPNSVYNRGWLRVCEATWEEAKPYLKRAADLYSSDGNDDRAVRALSLYAWAEFRMGNVESAARVLRDVRENGLIPLPMLKYALKEPKTTASRTIAEINGFLRDEPDQACLLFLWLYETRRGKDEKDQILTACRDAIDRAHNAIFRSVLQRLMAT